MPLRMSERTTPRQKTQITIATKTPTIAKSFLVTGRWAKMFPRTLMGDQEPGDESCNSSITLHWTLLKIWWCLRNYPGVPLVITPVSLWEFAFCPKWRLHHESPSICIRIGVILSAIVTPEWLPAGQPSINCCKITISLVGPNEFETRKLSRNGLMGRGVIQSLVVGDKHHYTH